MQACGYSKSPAVSGSGGPEAAYRQRAPCTVCGLAVQTRQWAQRMQGAWCATGAGCARERGQGVRGGGGRVCEGGLCVHRTGEEPALRSEVQRDRVWRVPGQVQHLQPRLLPPVPRQR